MSIKTSRPPRFSHAQKNHPPRSSPLCSLHFGVQGVPPVWPPAAPVCIGFPSLGCWGFWQCQRFPFSGLPTYVSQSLHGYRLSGVPISGPRGTHGSPLSMVPTPPGCRGSPNPGSTFHGPGDPPYRDLGLPLAAEGPPAPVPPFSAVPSPSPAGARRSPRGSGLTVQRLSRAARAPAREGPTHPPAPNSGTPKTAPARSPEHRALPGGSRGKAAALGSGPSPRQFPRIGTKSCPKGAICNARLRLLRAPKIPAAAPRSQEGLWSGEALRAPPGCAPSQAVSVHAVFCFLCLDVQNQLLLRQSYLRLKGSHPKCCIRL